MHSFFWFSPTGDAIQQEARQGQVVETARSTVDDTVPSRRDGPRDCRERYGPK
jgi:hypothetical protein